MSLEWIDPPRDYRDEAADIAEQLKANPGQWARIGEGGRYQHDYLDCLYYTHDIEYRVVNEREVAVKGRARLVADLYARAPQGGRVTDDKSLYDDNFYDDDWSPALVAAAEAMYGRLRVARPDWDDFNDIGIDSRDHYIIAARNAVRAFHRQTEKGDR